MALNQWFKFYGGEYLSDPKIASLSAQERSCWVTLLCLASISSTPGVIEFLTVEVLLDKSGIPCDPYNPAQWNAALSVLDRFVKMKMITKNEDGSIAVNNWKKRQEMTLTNAERQANYRRRNAGVTGVTTNVTVDKMRLDKSKKDFSIEKSPPLEIVRDEEKKPRVPPDKRALTLRDWCYDKIEDEYDQRPTTNMGDYLQITKALKHLSDKDVKLMMEDALSAGKGQTVRSVFTDREIDIYRQENL